MRSLLFSISFLAILILSQSAMGQSAYETYSNSRFEYSIDYPKAIFTPQEEAPNGDGRVFLGKGGSELRVWGQNNALFDTLKKAYADDLKERGAAVTYKALLKDGYVISGAKGGKVFYQKTMLNGTDGDGGAIWATFTIEYRKKEKAKYDPIVRRIASSFKFD